MDNLPLDTVLRDTEDEIYEYVYEIIVLFGAVRFESSWDRQFRPPAGG